MPGLLSMQHLEPSKPHLYPLKHPMKTILQNKNLTILFASTFLFFCNEAMFLPTMPLYLLKAGYTNTEIGIIQGSFALEDKLPG